MNSHDKTIDSLKTQTKLLEERQTNVDSNMNSDYDSDNLSVEQNPYEALSIHDTEEDLN